MQVLSHYDTILSEVLDGGNYFMHFFIQWKEFYTEEKLQYLIPKVDLERVNRFGRTFMDELIEDITKADGIDTNIL